MVTATKTRGRRKTRKVPRQLYQCANARVKGEVIYCAAGHELFSYIAPYSQTKFSQHPMKRFERGAPLELTVCQKCKDYDEMGPPIPKEERGWMV